MYTMKQNIHLNAELISNTSYMFPLLDIWDSEKVGFKEFLEIFNVFELHHFIGSGRFERF